MRHIAQTRVPTVASRKRPGQECFRGHDSRRSGEASELDAALGCEEDEAVHFVRGKGRFVQAVETLWRDDRRGGQVDE
jgi:hypothetical protein